jgi:hypothetical protein
MAALFQASGSPLTTQTEQESKEVSEGVSWEFNKME